MKGMVSIGSINLMFNLVFLAQEKCDCPFKLKDKPISNGDGWMLKVICGYHNHDVS